MYSKEQRGIRERAETDAVSRGGAAGRTVSYEERAAFYEVEYSDSRDQAFLRGLVTDGVNHVLEIPCGSGRNLDWLIRTGCFVVCADAEPAMVERLWRRVTYMGAGDRVRSLVADMRALELGRSFDRILVPQEAFQLLPDDADALRALKRFREHLAPRGTLMIDLFTFAPDDRGERCVYPDYFDPEIADGTLVEEWTRSTPDGAHLSRSRIQHREPEAVWIEYLYALAEGERIVDRWRSEIRLKLHDLGSFTELVEEADLEIKQAFRNYSYESYAPGAARLVTLIGHRNPDRRP